MSQVWLCGLDSAISCPSDYAGESILFFMTHFIAFQLLDVKTSHGKPSYISKCCGCLCKLFLSTPQCVQCKHNCPTAHHLPVNSPLNIIPFGSFGSFDLKPFQQIKCVWVSMHTMLQMRTGDWSCCTCVNSWSKFLLQKSKETKNWIKSKWRTFACHCELVAVMPALF